MSLDAGERFIAWLRSEGGHFPPDLRLVSDLTGLSVKSSTDLPIDSRLISCPFDLAITTQTAQTALATLYPNDAQYSAWSERMLVAAYVVLHWIHLDINDTDRAASQNDAQGSTPLRHRAYIDVLPRPADLRTPSYFTEAERDLLAGTNLEGVVGDREAELREEHARVSEVVREATWDQYLAATTYISSRAFPSRLLQLPKDGGTETGPRPEDGKGPAAGGEGQTDESGSYPLLLPGLDLLNHSRGQPITWLSSLVQPSSSSPTTSASGPSTNGSHPTPPSPSPIPCVSFINPTPIPAHTQVHNNYGPKSNEELLLSYGFVLDPNPDDTLILRLGSPPQHVVDQLARAGLNVQGRFALRRDGAVPQELLAVMRALMGGPPAHAHGEGCGHDHDDDEDDDEDGHAAHEQEMEEMQLEMDVLGELGGMLEDKLDKLRAGAGGNVGEGVREDVRRMVGIYRQGQIDIIAATQDQLAERIERLEGMVDQGMGTCPCGC